MSSRTHISRFSLGSPFNTCAYNTRRTRMARVLNTWDCLGNDYCFIGIDVCRVFSFFFICLFFLSYITYILWRITPFMAVKTLGWDVHMGYVISSLPLYLFDIGTHILYNLYSEIVEDSHVYHVGLTKSSFLFLYSISVGHFETVRAFSYMLLNLFLLFGFGL